MAIQTLQGKRGSRSFLRITTAVLQSGDTKTLVRRKTVTSPVCSNCLFDRVNADQPEKRCDMRDGHWTELTKRPKASGCPAPVWWQSLLVFEYMTGWRIGEQLALRRNDLDLERGVAITRADDNKGSRDEPVQLPPVVVEHLRGICSFHSHDFH